MVNVKERWTSRQVKDINRYNESHSEEVTKRKRHEYTNYDMDNIRCTEITWYE